jgi:hypothetical protein
LSKWDIRPEGVRAVLSRVNVYSEELAAAVKSFGVDLGSAANATGSGIIATALSEFLSTQSSALGHVGDLVCSAETGAVGATNAYLNADEQMAADAQRTAAIAAGVILAPAAARHRARVN